MKSVAKIFHSAAPASARATLLATLLLGISLVTACASLTHTTHTQPTRAQPFGSKSGVQMYGEIDMGYGYTRHKTTIQR